VGLGEGRVCAVPRVHGGTDPSGDEAAGLSPTTSASSHTPRHVPGEPWPAGGAAGIKEAGDAFLAEVSCPGPKVAGALP